MTDGPTVFCTHRVVHLDVNGCEMIIKDFVPKRENRRVNPRGNVRGDLGVYLEPLLLSLSTFALNRLQSALFAFLDHRQVRPRATKPAK